MATGTKVKKKTTTATKSTSPAKTINTQDAVDTLTAAEVEEFAKATLEWRSGGYYGQRFAHNRYKTTGFPTGSNFDNKTFANRQEYLVYRLKKFIGKKGRIAYNEAGKAAAKEIEKQRKVKEAEARMKNSLNIKVVPAFQIQLTEYKVTSPHTFDITVDYSTNRFTGGRAQNSIGRNVCTATRNFSMKSFAEAIEIVSSDEFDKVMNAVKDIWPNGLPKGVEVQEAPVTATVKGQDEHGYANGMTLATKKENGKTLCDVRVDGYTFTFLLSDLVTLNATLGKKYKAVEVEETKEEETKS